jgi:hypothetical protein
MAILTEGAGSSNLGSATAPMQAVQEASPLDSLAGLAGGGLSVLNTKNQADASQAKAQAVLDKDAKTFAGEQQDTALSQTLMKVSLKFEQSGNRDEAIRLSRKALNNALNNPGNDGRGDDIISTYTKFMAVQGLGKDFFEESAQEKVVSAQMDRASKAGVQFLESDSEEVVSGKLENFRKYEAASEALSRTSSELAVANAKLTQAGKVTSNESSALQLERTKLEIKRSEALTSMSDGYNTIFQDKLLNARKAFDVSGDMQTALDAVETGYFQISNLISSTGGTGNVAQITALTSPMTNMYEATKRYIKGTDTLEVLNNTRKIEDARIVALMFAKNPEQQQRIALSNLIGNTDIELSGVIAASAISYIDSSLANKPVALTGLEPKEQKAIVNVGLSFIEKDTAGKVLGLEKEEGYAYIEKLFTDFDKYSASVDNPQELNELVTMIADPRFGTWVKANKGIPASISSQVKDTLKAFYSEPVMKDVVQNWEMDVAGDQKAFGFNFLGTLTDPISENSFNKPATKVAALPDILEPFMTESGLSFRAKQGAPQNLVAPALKQVNKTVLPKINRLIKAMAHVEGHTDYNKVFEESYAKILGVAPDEVPKKEKAPLASETFVPKTDGTVRAGDVVEGVRFKGGDVADSTNWEEFKEGSVIKVGDVVNGQKYTGGGTSNPANWVRSDE